ncbi:MAG: hypothetical protein WBL45_05980 [Solirubrobacterales bacterium]
MAAQGQKGTAEGEDRSAAISEVAWVGILAALVAVLSPLVVLVVVPETMLEIVAADVIFVALVSILIHKVETALESKGHRTLFTGRPALSLILASLALGGIAGALTELASSADDQPVRPAIIGYESQLRQVFNPLRKASASAFETPGSVDDPDLYAKDARVLSDAYRSASEVLTDIEPPRRGDQVVHSRLRVRLASIGVAYARLGEVVAARAGESSVAAAEAKVRAARRTLRESEEQLSRRGFRVTVGS